ncbi:hypothetical protein JIN85_18395 [Luteolibacter pohnpeiensis]|uniref:Uncharacterized protein n=1 Tax=Luteolibacter pohnpeiensis TaxID=454153 RepID=A0A934SEG7_9BACT|nr:hypothetical protein [Luteolibacter pohnpeiensis]MBK1884394.1 hypothetical protein [Luteolibacter pohnpeiensis]
MSLLHPTPTISTFSQKLSNELEEILSDLNAKDAAAANAQSAYEEVQHTSKQLLHDDGTLSASELLDKRKQAERTVELCQIETSRIVRDRDSAWFDHNSTLLDRWDEVCSELYRLAKERAQYVSAQILAFIPQDRRESHSVTQPIEEVLKHCDGIGNRRSEAQRYSRMKLQMTVGGKSRDPRKLIGHLKAALPLLEENPTPSAQQ